MEERKKDFKLDTLTSMEKQRIVMIMGS